MSEQTKEIPAGKRNIGLELRTWNALKNLKKPNETFNDVILSLLNQKTISKEEGNLKAIKYNRKILFMETKASDINDEPIGVEFEYNDIKGQQTEFTLDLKLKKIFYGKRIMNPSEFFGVDSSQKHLNPTYLAVYLRGVSLVLSKEFRTLNTMMDNKDFENIAKWRKLYYDYSLSEESFISDVEEPLRLSEEEKISPSIRERIKNSPSNSIWKIIT